MFGYFGAEGWYRLCQAEADILPKNFQKAPVQDGPLPLDKGAVDAAYRFQEDFGFSCVGYPGFLPPLGLSFSPPHLLLFLMHDKYKTISRPSPNDQT